LFHAAKISKKGQTAKVLSSYFLSSTRFCVSNGIMTGFLAERLCAVVYQQKRRSFIGERRFRVD
jgi:hypothetical protein